MTDFNYDHTHRLKKLIPSEEITEIDNWIKKYPPERKRPTDYRCTQSSARSAWKLSDRRNDAGGCRIS